MRAAERRGSEAAAMDEITRGIRSVLGAPRIYNAFQWLIGADTTVKTYVEDYVVPRAGARILDIGCGPGKVLEFLPRDVEYVGFDMNPSYIAYAERRFKGRGTFRCARVSGQSVTEMECFDIVQAMFILHHLSDGEAAQLFENAAASLRPGGYLVTIDPVIVDRQSRIARYVISKDRGQHVRTPEAYATLARSVFASVEMEVRHDLLRIPYSHCILKCTKHANAGGD